MSLPSRPAEIEAYFAEVPDGVAVAVPAAAYRSRGLRVGVILPLVWLFLGAYFAVASELGTPAMAVAGGLAVLSAAWGAFIAVGADAASAATRITIGADGTLTLRGGRSLPPGTVRSLRIVPPASAKLAVVADTAAGPLEILGDIPVTDGARAKPVAEWLGAALGVAADTRAAPNALGWSPNNFAMLCYMPVQGIWLVASIFALVASADPFVRFAGKQSLAFYVVSGVLLAVVLAAAVGIGLATSSEVALIAGIMVGVGLMLARLGVGLYAGMQAYRGVTWVIPGFGWLGEPPRSHDTLVPDPAAGAWQPPAHQG